MEWNLHDWRFSNVCWLKIKEITDEKSRSWSSSETEITWWAWWKRWEERISIWYRQWSFEITTWSRVKDKIDEIRWLSDENAMKRSKAWK